MTAEGVKNKSLTNSANGPAYATGCAYVNVGVPWLHTYMDQAGSWYERTTISY